MAMKRPSTVAAASRAKRRHVAKDVATVVGAIVDSDALASDLRSVLKAGLPVVLAANKADRHRFEDEIVQQAERALAAVQSSVEASHKAACEARDVVVAKEERQKRQAAKKAAEETREQLKLALRQSATEKEGQEQAVQGAKKALKDASKDASKADADMQQTTEKKDILSAALGDLDTLKENRLLCIPQGRGGSDFSAWSSVPEGKKALKKLAALAKEHDFDATMTSSFATAAKKASAQRSEFEVALFSNFQAAMTRQIEVFTQQLAEMEPAKAEKHAAEEAAKAALATAQDALSAGKDALAKADAAYKDSGKDLHKATTYLSSVWDDMKKACEAADDLEAEVKDFKENLLVKFEHLKNLEPEPEVVEEAAEDAAPAAVDTDPVEAGVEAAKADTVVDAE